MIEKNISRSEQKRRQILEAATSLFVSQGYHSSSMEQIAALANVSKQTVYSHFANKQQLFKAAIETRRSNYELSDTTLFQPDAAPAETLLQLARALLDLLLSDDGICANRVCCAEAEAHPEAADVFFKEGPEYVTAMLTDYLQEQVNRGQLVIANPRHAAIQFLYMVKGEAHMRALLGQAPWRQEEVAEYLESCVDVFLRAYAASEARS